MSNAQLFRNYSERLFIIHFIVPFCYIICKYTNIYAFFCLGKKTIENVLIEKNKKELIHLSGLAEMKAFCTAPLRETTKKIKREGGARESLSIKVAY